MTTVMGYSDILQKCTISKSSREIQTAVRLILAISEGYLVTKVCTQICYCYSQLIVAVLERGGEIDLFAFVFLLYRRKVLLTSEIDLPISSFDRIHTYNINKPNSPSCDVGNVASVRYLCFSNMKRKFVI
jgi:hypothetical protein